MKPLFFTVVLLLLHNASLEESKQLTENNEPKIESEDDEAKTRDERCTTCSGSLNLNAPRTVVHTQSSFEECSSNKGCAGIKVKDGRVIERFGNLDAFHAAAASDTNNEFSFHAAGNLANVFNGGIPKDGPFWWMNENSPFKDVKAGGTSFSETSSSSFTSTDAGTTGAGGASLDISGNPFLNGGFAKGSIGSGIKPGGSNFQSSSFESSFSSNKGQVDVSKNPFLAAKAGESTYQSGSQFGSGFTGSTPGPFTASTAGAGINLIQNEQKEYQYTQQSQTGSSNFQGGFQGANQGGQQCSGQNYVCVTRAQCTNGVVNPNAARLIQSANKKPYCNSNTEICCRFDGANTANAFGQTSGGSFSGSNTGFASGSNSFGSTSKFNSQGSSSGSFGSNAQANTDSFGAASINRGTATGFQSSSSFGSNSAGSAFGSTLAPGVGSNSRFGSTNSGSSQGSFVSDSFSAGSETSSIYRPGAAGSVLKPGIPYLPPVDSNTAQSVVSTTQTYRPPPTTPRPIYTTPAFVPSTYLPPQQQQQTIQKEVKIPGEKFIDGQLILDETIPGRRPTPPPPRAFDLPSGCAAALKCTPLEFCTSDGVISNTSVRLTQDQESYRVPLTDCKDLSSGLVGKCCRDPTYTDPWPVNQLGRWLPDVWGDGKYTVEGKGQTNRIQVTGRPEVTGRIDLNQYSKTTVESNRVTPGFGVTQNQYDQEGRYSVGQGKYTKFGQTQVGQTGQVSVVQQQQDYNRNQLTQTGNQFGVQTGKGQYFQTGQGKYSVGGQGQVQVGGQGQIAVQEQGSRNQISQVQRQDQIGVIQNQGQYTTQDVGTGVRFGQGSTIKQGVGYVVQNQYAAEESIYRVFLQQYSVDGQCGISYGQKPYGNRNELEVDFAEIPWQAMVLLQTNKSLLCGGVITRPDVVLTSASCVEGLQAKNVLIKGGEWRLGIDEEPLPFQIVQVKHILRHPEYRAGSLENDVAILVLNEDLRLAQNIYPICLPGARDNLDAFYSGNGECIVTGWGKQVLQANILGSVMHSVSLNLIRPEVCQSKLSQEYPHLLSQYSDSCVCGQPTNPVNNICKVDTGSALACTNGDGHYVLRGVFSWDSGCQPGNQLAAFYNFDLEWYQWAIGLAENARFAQYSVGTQTSQNQYNNQISGGIAGQQNQFATQINNGIQGSRTQGTGGSGQYSQFQTTKTSQSTGFGGVAGTGGGALIGTGSNVGSLTGGSGQYSQFQTTKTSQSSGTGGGAVFGAGSGGSGRYDQYQTKTTQVSGAGGLSGSAGGSLFGIGGNIGINGGSGQYNQFQATKTSQSSGLGGIAGIGSGAGAIIGAANLGVGGGSGQYSQYQTSKTSSSGAGANAAIASGSSVGVAGSGFNQFAQGSSEFSQVGAPVQKTYTATFEEKKFYQSKPEIITYTTKPEIVTFTTKPEYFTYTTKPKLVTYTTKPQIISYKTSGSDLNPSYVAPGTSNNPSFGSLVGHTHSAQCKCLENGKK